MVPQETIWQKIRERALETVPEGSAVSYSAPPSLESWLQIGAFNVISVTAKRFLLHAASADIGSTLLSESYYNADHALEHAISLRHQLACGRWGSPAWTTVTFYYWAYHLAVALTRLLGKTVWYVSPTTASQLRSLASSGTARPGAGPYVLNCGQSLSATVREVLITRSAQTRAHDAVWNLWFSELRTFAAGIVGKKAVGPEARLYLSLIQTANALGDKWPSDLRNALNYGTASAYGAVRNRTPTAVYGIISVDPSMTVLELIERLEANSAALSKGVDLSNQLPTATKVLIYTAFAMDVILQALLVEVAERRAIDRRWANARSAFLKAQARGFAVQIWPCRANDDAA